MTTSLSSKVLGLILLAAFLGRLTAGLSLRPPPSEWQSFYLDAAKNLAHGQGYFVGSPNPFSPDVQALRPPLYPVLLALWLKIFGLNRLLVAAHAALGTLVVWLVYLTACEVDSQEAGLLAAAAAAVYPYYVFNDTAPWDRMPFTLAVAWTVLSVLRNAPIQIGVGLGLSCLIRPTGAFFVPAFAAWIWRFSPSPRKTALTAGAAFLMTLAPWLARNGALFGRPVYVSSAGLELWDAHVALAQDCGYPWVSVDRCTEMAAAAVAPAEIARLQGMGERERDRDLLAQALRFIVDHPAVEARLAFKKLQGLYSPRFNPQWDLELKPIHSRAARWLHAACYAAVSIGAALALWSFGRRSPFAWLCILLFLALSFCTLIFLGHTVHRAPLDFLLIALSGVYVASMRRKRI